MDYDDIPMTKPIFVSRAPAFVPRAAEELADAARAHPYTAVTIGAAVVATAAWKTFGLLRPGGPASRLSTAASKAIKAQVRDWTADPLTVETAIALGGPAAPGRRTIVSD